MSKLVDYIVLTEFDINAGSVVRLIHPSPIPTIDTQSIADNMIPEGSHNFSVLSSNFVLGRKAVKDLQTDQNRAFASSANLMQKLISAEAFKALRNYIDENAANTQEAKLYKLVDLKWVPVSKDPATTFEFQFIRSQTSLFAFRFLDTQTQSKASAYLEVDLHPWFEFRPVVENAFKCTFRTRTGQFYGVKLEKRDKCLNFQTMAKLGLQYSPYSVFEQTLNASDQTVFFYSILMNRLSDQVKRGSIVKALAFGSHSPVHLESLTCLIEAALDTIFGKTDVNRTVEQNVAVATQIVEELYKSVNKHTQTSVPRGNFITRAVSHDLNTNLAWNLPVNSDAFGNYRDSLYFQRDFTVDKYPSISSKVVMPLATPMDQIAASSLMKFITKFGTKTMFIYDALL